MGDQIWQTHMANLYGPQVSKTTSLIGQEFAYVDELCGLAETCMVGHLGQGIIYDHQIWQTHMAHLYGPQVSKTTSLIGQDFAYMLMSCVDLQKHVWWATYLCPVWLLTVEDCFDVSASQIIYHRCLEHMRNVWHLNEKKKSYPLDHDQHFRTAQKSIRPKSAVISLYLCPVLHWL